MPEANSASVLSNPPSRYPQIAPEPAQKPKFLFHSTSKTVTIYAHVLTRHPAGAHSPMDGLQEEGVLAGSV